jgi:hypothetical protein
MTTTRKTWEDFEKAGLLWFVNRILHVFGWVIICVESTGTGEIEEVWPARTNMLGFTEEVDAASHEKFMAALHEDMF